ncbi:MAG: hypothetical protein WBA86_23080 [Nodosilinea sp.]
MVTETAITLGKRLFFSGGSADDDARSHLQGVTLPRPQPIPTLNYLRWQI